MVGDIGISDTNVLGTGLAAKTTLTYGQYTKGT